MRCYLVPLALLVLAACSGTTTTDPVLKIRPSSPAAGPAGATQVELRWLVYPAIPHAQAPSLHGMATLPIELVVRVAGVSRNVKLQGKGMALLPEHQGVCQRTDGHPQDRKDLAKISFHADGTSGYVVRRDTPRSIAVTAFSRKDVACATPEGEAVACPIDERVVARVEIPRGATFQESMRLVDRGKDEPLRCP
jgi:hypothetical protein